MTVFFTNVNCIKFTIKKLLQGALRYLNQPVNDVCMSLSFVSQEEIRQLNCKFRGIDAVTDVLSFPAIDNPTRAVIDVHSFEADSLYPETGKLNLGDVIICLDRAREQAADYGHSLKRELCFLSLHGLLHLLGYDHETPEDESQMFILQDEILDKMRVARR